MICESRGFAGVRARTVAPTNLTPVTGTGGQVGGFLHTDVAPLLEDNSRAVLYVGDFDPQSEDIEANTRRVLEAAAGERDWRRVALNAEQAAGMVTATKVDRRFRPPRSYEAVGVEALGQTAVTTLGARCSTTSEALRHAPRQEVPVCRQFAYRARFATPLSVRKPVSRVVSPGSSEASSEWSPVTKTSQISLPQECLEAVVLPLVATHRMRVDRQRQLRVGVAELLHDDRRRLGIP